MYKLEVGEKLDIMQVTHNLPQKDGMVMELDQMGGFFSLMFLRKPKTDEINDIKYRTIQLAVIEDGIDKMMFLFKITSHLIFEIIFDPTLYTKSKIKLTERPDELYKKSNLNNIVLVDSSTNIIKALRIVNFPKEVHSKMCTYFDNALQKDDYTSSYYNWVAEKYQKNIIELWDGAEKNNSVYNMGE